MSDLTIVFGSDWPFTIVDATLTREGRTLAHHRYPRVDRGRRSLSLSIPRSLRDGRARLTLDVVDAFGNRRTLRRSVVLG